MGDLVCLHKDNIVPVSWLSLAQTPCSWGRAASLLVFLLCMPPPPVLLLPPPSPATPGRCPLAGQHGAQQSVLRGDSRHRRVRRSSSLGLGGWEPARPSPMATKGGSPSPRGYCGHSSWEHLWGTAKRQGARTFSQRKGPTFSAPTYLEALLCSRCGRLKLRRPAPSHKCPAEMRARPLRLLIGI